MNSNEYQKLAKLTKSPNGLDTFQRFINSVGVYESGMEKLMDVLGEIDFDNLKRVIFYANPGDQSLSSESDSEIDLIHGTLGLLSEVFEFLEIIREQDHIDPVHLKEELGDLLWYIALIASSQGIELRDVFESNIRKLALRNKNKGQFDLAGTLERSLDKEYEVLSGKGNPEKLTEDIGCSIKR